MAAEATGSGSIEVAPFLKYMPVAPEFHPTLSEFQDPVAYISKIEKEASKYGICKIVPPIAAASRKSVFSNFNKSLLARSSDPDLGPCFTTRQQQIGFCPRKHRPVQKSVWQSGERYTLDGFEAKAKNFEKNYLKKYTKKGLNALEMETLFWNAMLDKPFSVEYANDMPGSAFMVPKNAPKRNEGAVLVGETEWNMRKVSRENLSLLKFMKEEIAGVTSPMVYVAMMFSWFAWHVEDHDFHSLNYLHLGASKTWYGVPREAAVAFEEVIREHGYGGEINPIATFATLGKKTTVMSPEVLLNAGVPCCRLVQNAGDFVVTFPRAYHSGFSHGFNCGEAANIATPEWLRVAKEAAIRRAAINCPPMISHFQLHYDLALSLSSSVPNTLGKEPRSCRLKDRKKGEGEKLIKELFLEDMLQNNDTLHILGKGSSIVLLPKNSLRSVALSDSSSGLQSKITSSMFHNLFAADNNSKTTDEYYVQEIDEQKTSSFCSRMIPYLTHSGQIGSERTSPRELGLFSCVSCGVICYACVAIVRPTEAAARSISSADFSLFNFNDNVLVDAEDAEAFNAGGMMQTPVTSVERREEEVDGVSTAKGLSSLSLLASAYGNFSDSEEDSSTCIPPEGSVSPEKTAPCKTETPAQVASSDAKSGDSPMLRTDRDSSRLHVFCLQHALQVERQLVQFGGAHVFLACRPDYPTLESQAKMFAEELETHAVWNAVSFRESTEEDEKIIQQALESENAIHGNGDWAVKLGINLFYSANLSCSPLYSKQMHYNSIIYAAFGRSSHTGSYTMETESDVKGFGRQRKVSVAGKWCGKVWMSNQVHPMLVARDSQLDSDIFKGEKGIPDAGKAAIVYEKRKKSKLMEDKSAGSSELLHGGIQKSRRKQGLRRLKEECLESTVSFDDKMAETAYESSEEFPLSNTWRMIKEKGAGKRSKNTQPQSQPNPKKSKKEFTPVTEDDQEGGGYSMRLRKRVEKPCKKSAPQKSTEKGKKPDRTMAAKKCAADEEGEYTCDMEGCSMSFGSRHDLAVHKRNTCPVKGCGKKFFLHKYLLQHRRVHMDDRPLKCPWKGCKMAFKWAWARTEHIRVHTGERPYVCNESGCGKTFRFVSDFSRHKRKTGHVPKKARG